MIDMNKLQYHKQGKKILKELADKLGLAVNSYDIRSNKGGPAVLGEIILHSESLYVMIGGLNPNNVLYRSCKGRTDYSGGPNHYLIFDKLLMNESLNCFRKVADIVHATCTREIANAFGFDKLPSHLITITD